MNGDNYGLKVFYPYVRPISLALIVIGLSTIDISFYSVILLGIGLLILYLGTDRFSVRTIRDDYLLIGRKYEKHYLKIDNIEFIEKIELGDVEDNYGKLKIVGGLVVAISLIGLYFASILAGILFKALLLGAALIALGFYFDTEITSIFIIHLSSMAGRSKSPVINKKLLIGFFALVSISYLLYAFNQTFGILLLPFYYISLILSYLITYLINLAGSLNIQGLDYNMTLLLLLILYLTALAFIYRFYVKKRVLVLWLSSLVIAGLGIYVNPTLMAFVHLINFYYIYTFLSTYIEWREISSSEAAVRGSSISIYCNRYMENLMDSVGHNLIGGELGEPWYINKSPKLDDMIVNLLFVVVGVIILSLFSTLYAIGGVQLVLIGLIFIIELIFGLSFGILMIIEFASAYLFKLKSSLLESYKIVIHYRGLKIVRERGFLQDVVYLPFDSITKLEVSHTLPLRELIIGVGILCFIVLTQYIDAVLNFPINMGGTVVNIENLLLVPIMLILFIIAAIAFYIIQNNVYLSIKTKTGKTDSIVTSLNNLRILDALFKESILKAVVKEYTALMESIRVYEETKIKPAIEGEKLEKEKEKKKKAKKKKKRKYVKGEYAHVGLFFDQFEE